jgi:hypothetical protein
MLCRGVEIRLNARWKKSHVSSFRINFRAEFGLGSLESFAEIRCLSASLRISFDLIDKGSRPPKMP